MACRHRPLNVIFTGKYAGANADLACCPRGQLHRVALCPESVGLGKWSAGDKVDAKATVVVVVIVFTCVCAGLRVFRPLAGLFFGVKLTCTDANKSWL